MEYKTKQIKETFDDIELKINVIDNLEETIDQMFEELSRQGAPDLLNELCPYFGEFWPSAAYLAQLMLSLPIKDKNILELGCGLAVPSMISRLCGANVTASDSHPDVPKFLDMNTKENNITGIRYTEINFSEQFQELSQYDYIIASDVMYERDQIQPILQIIQTIDLEKQQLILIDPDRPHWQNLEQECRRNNLPVNFRKVSSGIKVPENFIIISNLET